MNLSALRDRARALSGIRLQTLRSDEQIDSVINESYQEVLELSQWPFLLATETVSLSANSEEFTTPVSFSEVASVVYEGDFQKTTKMRQTTIDELEELDDQSGDPVYFARLNESDFRVWPVSESSLSLTVRGKLLVSNLSKDSDAPVFAEQFHPILAYRAAVKMLQEEGDDSGRSQFYQQEAGNFYSRMQQFYNKSGDKGLFVMGGRGRRRRLLSAY
jgi:hypothetical protein